MTARLQRHIGLLALTLYGVGDILGAGVYGLVGKAAGEMGNAVWLGFLVSMIAAGLTGLSYASIGSRHPKAAGAAYVTQRAFSKPFLAYVVGLAVFASGLTSMATASRVFSGYLTGLVSSLPLEVAIILFASLITFVVFWGIRESMWANALCTLIEVSGLLFVLFVGISYWGSVDYLDATTVANSSGDISISLMLTGAVLTFYSFIGFEDILNVSEEVKEPEKNIPRGLILAVVISSVIYMAISITAVSVVPAGELAGSKQPLVDVVAKAAPWFPSSVYSFVAMFAVANTALLNFVMGSRLIYGMSKQGLLPQLFSKVHGKRHTPHMAIGVIFCILLGLALSGDVSSLAKATSVLILGCFIVVNFALVILQRRKGEPKGSFEVPTFVPVLGSLICAAMLSFAKTAEIVTAAIILAVIVGLYFLRKPSADIAERLDLVVED